MSILYESYNRIPPSTAQAVGIVMALNGTPVSTIGCSPVRGHHFLYGGYDGKISHGVTHITIK